MGRAGSGSGSSGSSGGHSSSRSSGGHRSSSGGLNSSGSGNRAGSGSRTSGGSFLSPSSRTGSTNGNTRPSRGSGGGPMGRPPMGGSPRGGSMGGPMGGPPRGGSMGGPMGGLPRGGPSSGPSGRYSHNEYGGSGRRHSVFSYIVAFVVILIILFFVLGRQSKAGYISSTIVRTKLESVSGFDSNCVIDELNWVDNVSKTGSRLKEFYKKTGVQPYILLRDYDPSLTTDSEKEIWAVNYYDEYIDREDAFLFVYFAEEDTDNDVGYMAYVNGLMTSSVMDSKAVEIFWNNIDKYWYTNMSTDDVLVSAFVDTGKTIMKVPTNGWDVLKTFLIIVGIIVVLIIILAMIIIKAQRAKQKAEEDQRILETDINNYLK